MTSTQSDLQQLCVECGLCCNGVIFADVRLQNEDNDEALRSAGLPLKAFRCPQPAGERAKVPQPCAALLGDGRCKVYGNRPRYCRDFECALFKAAKARRIPARAAMNVIAQAHRRVEKVRRLLRQLGNHEEGTALAARFRRVKRQFESGVFPEVRGTNAASPRSELNLEQRADLFGDLTMAVQDVNYLLSEVFYPGGSEPGDVPQTNH